MSEQPKVREAAPEFTTAAWSDAVRLLHPDHSLAPGCISSLQALRIEDRAMGPAYTIRLRRAAKASAAQRDAYLDAFDQAPPGSMVVVEVIGDVGGAVLGDLVGRRLRHIGVAGVLLEGAIRDRIAQQEVAPPIWFANSAMNGIQSSAVLTEVNVAARVGRVTISPGDVVCADADGVLVLSQVDFDHARPASEATESLEKTVASRLAAGASLREALNSRLAES